MSAPAAETARSRAGFTLIEVLVATALSAVVMMGLFSMFSSVADVAVDIRVRENTSSGERTLEGVLFDDLRSVFAEVGDDYGFSGKSGSFLGADGEFLSLCTSASLNSVSDTPSFSLHRVEYLLKDDGDSNGIYRREKKHCGVSGDWEWVEVLIMRGVEKVEIEYLNPADNSLASEWSGGGRYPAAVKVRITHADEREQAFTVGLSTVAADRE